MSAVDYEIVSGWRRPYFAKKNKSKDRISKDRREITDNEIVGLFNWYLENWSDEHPNETLVISDKNGDKLFEATYYGNTDE